MIRIYVFTVLLILVIHISDSRQKSLKYFPEECFTATELDEDSRYFYNYNNYKQKSSSRRIESDLHLKKGWYRITGQAANSLMEGYNRKFKGDIYSHMLPQFCGTKYSGTLMGLHPTIDQGIVEMFVCFRDRFCFYDGIETCRCQSIRKIYALNCKKHFVYYLSPTRRNERYCTDKNWVVTPILGYYNKSRIVECIHYTTINDNSRIWNNITAMRPDYFKGWYRFSASSGTSQIASRCAENKLPIKRQKQPCGTRFRGWMTASHPSVFDGRVNRRVCFSYHDQCTCVFSTEIAVRNCGGYFVYRLHKPPLENARYCLSMKGSYSVIKNKNKTSTHTPGQICKRYKTIYNDDRLWDNTNPTASKCDANLYGTYRFRSKNIRAELKEGCNRSHMSIVTHRCGSRYQGYMEGRHPAVNDGYVRRIICFQSSAVPCECHFTTIIGVRNCSGYYVYDIRGVPRCDASFCTVDIKRKDEPSTVRSTKSNDDADSMLVVMATLLSSFFLLFVIFVLVVIFVIFYVRPLYRDHKKKQQQEQCTEVHL